MDTKLIIKSEGALKGTVVTYECPPKQECPECGGTGVCSGCNGKGEERCGTCRGSGRCDACNGKRSFNCDGCGGSGRCRTCKGTGEIRCVKCNGTGRVSYANSAPSSCSRCNGTGWQKCYDCSDGNCKKCKGSGQLTCKKCNGSGDCRTCKGKGFLICKECNGTGVCSNCKNGEVTCERCGGSGYFQSFIAHTSKVYSKSWVWSGSSKYKNIIAATTGCTVYDDVVKKWASATKIETDNTQKTDQEITEKMGEYTPLYGEFKEVFAKQTELKSPKTPNDKNYAEKLSVEKIPVTQIQYSINGKDYELTIIGDKHIVATESIPTQIESFKVSKWEKIKLALTERFRLKAYAKLAAYIFQCDSKSQDESILFEAMVKSLKLKPNKEQSFRKKLERFNSEMPYEKFRKHIRVLFHSKKALSFAWQCMAIDKNLSPQEEELFKKMVTEYKITDEEVAKLKSMSNHFSHLKPDQIAIEYADLAAEMTDLRKKALKYIAIGVASLLLVIGIVVVIVIL